MNEIYQNSPQTWGAKIAYAFLLSQASIANPTKSQKAYNYKFAPLDEVLEIIKAELAKNNIAISQTPIGEFIDNQVTIRTTLIWADGKTCESIYWDFSIPIKSGGSNLTQDYGSAVTYGRRYSALAIFSLAPEADDDGVGSKKRAAAKAAAVNPLPDFNETLDEVESRLDELQIAKWAEATGFIPHKAKLASLLKFLKLTDMELEVIVSKWNKSKEGK